MVNLVKFVHNQPSAAKHVLVQVTRYASNVKPCTGVHQPCCQRLYQINRREQGAATAQYTALPLLYHALRQPLLHATTARAGGMLSPAVEALKLRSIEMILYLLQDGHDPNEKFSVGDGHVLTPWIAWLDILEQKGINPALPLRDVQVTKLLLDAGATIFELESAHFPLQQKAMSAFDSDSLTDAYSVGGISIDVVLTELRNKLGSDAITHLRQ
jgi:hypothetical protein